MAPKRVLSLGWVEGEEANTVPPERETQKVDFPPYGGDSISFHLNKRKEKLLQLKNTLENNLSIKGINDAGERNMKSNFRALKTLRLVGIVLQLPDVRILLVAPLPPQPLRLPLP